MKNTDWRGAYQAMYEGEQPYPYGKVGDKLRKVAKERDAEKDPKKKNKLADRFSKMKSEYDLPEEAQLSEEGKKDACYHKVKSRYSVWPSAYASGALVKCRKKGAKNWGNSAKKEDLEMVFAFLINEGFAVTEDDALAIIEGMSENWYDMILEDINEEFG